MKRKAEHELIVKEIPIPSGAKHPQPKNSILPTHEFTFGIIAPKGSGKTTLIINLLNFYKKYFNQIIIFSPTIKNDEKWKYAKEQKYLERNLELRKVMKKINADKSPNTVVGERPNTIMQEVHAKPEKPKEAFTGKIPADCFITEYSQSDLISIMNEQQGLVDFLEKHDITKHAADRILLIFDDLVGSSLFTSKKEDPFTRLNTNHRHYSISILMVSQAYREIPKTVRTNFTCLILFKIWSEAEKESIMEEYPMGMPKRNWETVYDFCTAGEHDFLYFDIKKPRGHQIYHNFSKEVVLREQ
jgi:hypothetical protein